MINENVLFETGEFYGTAIQFFIDHGKKNVEGFRENSLSDGYHTFDELYEFRKMYNALLFNEWGSSWRDFQQFKDSKNQELQLAYKNAKGKYDVHKSWKHYDGEDCFGGGWFIVVAILPTGQISNHYKAKDWDLFRIPEVEKAKYEFDGHTPQDVLERLKALT